MEKEKEPKTYEEVADKAGLVGRTKERYVKYMRTRWGDKKEENVKCRVGYAEEWAYRFKTGYEFTCSDSTGQAVLIDIDNEKKEDKKDNILPHPKCPNCGRLLYYYNGWPGGAEYDYCWECGDVAYAEDGTVLGRLS